LIFNPFFCILDPYFIFR